MKNKCKGCDNIKGLYIHIPFCKSICSYCDFPKRLGDNELFDEYIDKLFLELDSYENELNNIDTVYIGGGTPNILNLNQLEKLFSKIKNILFKSKENTIELNPELITNDLCKLLNKYNFNRVSIGIESPDDKIIKFLNRHHKKEDIINSFKYLRNNNINNINCDLIFGIPNTNINDVKEDLSFILSLNPTHISYYDLIIEDRTLLSYLVKNKKIEPLDPDLEADMYDYINKILKEAGYNHYEVSNYAKENFESIHNMIYWTYDDYIGIGMAASSKINNVRHTNQSTIKAYFEAFCNEYDNLSIENQKTEFMVLGLRMLKGISIKEYERLFKSSPFDDFKFINKLIDDGLLVLDNNYLRIPENKMFIANVVWREFI